MSFTSGNEPDDEPHDHRGDEPAERRGDGPDEDPVQDPEELSGEQDAERAPMGAPILVNDHTLVEAVMIGMSNVEIAEILDVSARTISRRRNRPEVRRAIRTRTYEANAELRNEFRTLAPLAITAFKDTLLYGDNKTRLTAASAVMNRIFDNQRDDLEDRVRALESVDGPGEVLDDTEWPEDAE